MDWITCSIRRIFSRTMGLSSINSFSSICGIESALRCANAAKDGAAVGEDDEDEEDDAGGEDETEATVEDRARLTESLVRDMLTFELELEGEAWGDPESG